MIRSRLFRIRGEPAQDGIMTNVELFFGLIGIAGLIVSVYALGKMSGK